LERPLSDERPDESLPETIERQLEALRLSVLALDDVQLPPLEIGVVGEAAWASTRSDFLESCFGLSKCEQDWPIGSVYCLQCSNGLCEHAKPPSSDSVFERYTPNGKPVFRPMLEILLEQSPTLGEQLYRGPRKLVDYLRIHPQQQAPLVKDLRDGARVRVHAVLHLGFLQSRRIHEDKRCAVSILLLKEKGLYRLHQVGVEAELFERLAELPDEDHIKALNESLRFARRKLKRLRRKKRAGVADQKTSPVTVLKQLGTAMRRVSTKHRGRTEHAKIRHAQGDRPTGDALKDAQSVGAMSLLVDERRQTWVVIGKKGRAHLFATTGKHVTSIRLETGEVERKKGSGRWRSVDQNALHQFRAMFEVK
jgi:hypothetical protein